MNVECLPPIVKCLKHDRPCGIKTGTNPDSVETYKKSFYVCVEKPPCDFNRIEKGLKVLNCNVHKNEIVSKQVFVRILPGKIRRYYCCNVGHKETGKFCGHSVISQQEPRHLENQGLKDKTNETDKMKSKATIKPVESHITEKTLQTFNFSSLSLEISNLEEELLKKKKLVAVSNLSALPDGGTRIKEQIVQLESKISKLAKGQVKPQSIPPIQKSLPIVHPPKFIPTSDVPGNMANIQTERSALEKVISNFQDSLKSKPKEDEEGNDPDDLLIPLVQHQRRALSWLLWREKQHPSGGILADDMGLGKTLTMISLVLKTLGEKREDKGPEWFSKENNGKENRKLVKSPATLVICPASLLYHWEAEVKHRCRPKAVKIHVYFGPKSNRNNISKEKFAGYNMIVTTYDTVRSEITSSSGKSLLERIEFRRIILDEGHTIKNPKSQISSSVCNIAAMSRWVVSGTPIHNNLTDIYSLLRFLRCSPFDDFSTWKHWVDNKSPLGKRWLATIISCMLLRRTKTETDSEGKLLVSLPSKTIHYVELQLTKEENDIYRLLFNQSKELVRKYLEDRGEISGVKKDTAYARFENSSGLKLKEKFTSGSELIHILVTLLRLRQCCCHPSLLCEIFDVKCAKGSQSGDDLLDDLVSQMQDLQVSNPVPVVNDLVGADGKLGPTFDVNYQSTKINALLSRLDHKGKDNPRKSVIVSQWTSMLNVVAFHLKQVGIPFCQISGDVPVKDRMQIVESFNGSHKSGPQAMLLSLKAGGVGLNLIGGSNLFILDLHWNPALECQAIDRIHRMGQKKDVHVFRFICKDTIEVKIASLQDKKLLLAKSVVEGGKEVSTAVEQLRLLFGF